MVNAASNTAGRPAPRGWKQRLSLLIRTHAHTKLDGDGGKTATLTRRNLTTGLFRLFTALRKELGFGVENPQALDERHLRALAGWMERKWREGELQSSTIQGYVSYLRHLCRWIGKPELIESVVFTDPKCARRSLAATHDKTWEGNEVDVASKIEEAWDIEPWIAMALLAQAAFGLRRKEAVCLIPAQDYVESMGLLAITRGTKGGRIRHIKDLTAWQYEVLAVLIEFCRRGRGRKSHLGGDGRTLEQNLRRYTYVLGSRLGITKDLVGTTGHGLRAGFACRVLAAHGVTAPVKGGDVSAVPKDVRDLAYSASSEALGHSRHSVVGAYVGASRIKGDAEHPQGPDLARIDPPNMDQLIETLRGRRVVLQKEVRWTRDVAQAVGLIPMDRLI